MSLSRIDPGTQRSLMRKINLNKLKEGMILAEPAMTKGGQCIFEKGKTLTQAMIMRLYFYCIESVTIEGEDAPEADASSEVTPTAVASYSRQIKSSRAFQSFQVDHTLVLSTIRLNFEAYVNHGQPLDVSDLLSKVKTLFGSCKTSFDLFNMLHNMHTSKDSIYVHCLNVSLICRQLGKWLKFDSQKSDLITLCGLLHDIGKLKIPRELLDKPGKYTNEEFDLVKRHTRYGFDLLKDLPLDPRIARAALSHHERCDGSGYPDGSAQDDTDICALIVAIADVYDAMTAARAYRSPLCPFEVIERFEKEGLQKYHPKYILAFLQHIAATYQNHRVLLSDGRSGNVVMINRQSLSKPIIQFDDTSCIDLSCESDLWIQKVL